MRDHKQAGAGYSSRFCGIARRCSTGGAERSGQLVDSRRGNGCAARRTDGFRRNIRRRFPIHLLHRLERGTFLLTIFLKHDESKNQRAIESFPPEGNQMVS